MAKYKVNGVAVLYVTTHEICDIVFHVHRPAAPTLRHMWAISVDGVELEIRNVKTKAQILSQLRRYAKKLGCERFKAVVEASP